MTPQQIKANAPEGATHYDDGWDTIRYFKRKSKYSKYMEIYSNGKWYDTFLCMTEIVKPL